MNLNITIEFSSILDESKAVNFTADACEHVLFEVNTNHMAPDTMNTGGDTKLLLVSGGKPVRPRRRRNLRQLQA